MTGLDLSPVMEFALTAFLAVGAVAVLRSLRGGSATHRYKARRLQTTNEEEFFMRLRRAVPELHVFPQVALSALVEARGASNQDRLAAFRRISQKRVDWAICDQDLEVVCVVELDDATHDARRDADRDRILRSAGIPCIRWQSRGRPNSGEVRSRVMALCQLERVEEVLRQRESHR